MDAGYVIPCVILPERHRRSQVKEWDLALFGVGIGGVRWHLSMSQWLTFSRVVLHIARIAKQTLASTTLVLAFTYPTQMPCTLFALPEWRSVFVGSLPAVLASDRVQHAISTATIR